MEVRERSFTYFQEDLICILLIYSKKVSLIILAEMIIQGISAEDRALLSVVDQQGLAQSLAAVCNKKGATESNGRKSEL